MNTTTPIHPLRDFLPLEFIFFMGSNKQGIHYIFIHFHLLTQS
jgi:hypothetical protein